MQSEINDTEQLIIDNRDQQMLAEQVRSLVLTYCPEWKDEETLKADKQTDAIINIFSRMMEIIIQRLNRVPDKNFLTFLDLIGVHPSPPKIARAPLTFTMVEKASQHGSIPGGTQVAAKITDKETIVFETEKDLTIVSPALIKAVSISPDDDKCKDHSPVLFDKRMGGIGTLFKGEEHITHRLCLGHNELFGLKEPKTIKLDIELVSDDISLPDPWNVEWYYYSKESPDKIPLEISEGNNQANFTKSGPITFSNVGEISETVLEGFERENDSPESWKNHWIFAELTTPIPQDTLPEIKTIKITSVIIDLEPGSAKHPDIAFFNNFQLDLTKDFYPFGEKPKFNDTFLIGSKEVFSKKEATITVTVGLSSNLDSPDTTDITLQWEYWDGKKWVSNSFNVTDDTNAFTVTNKTIEITCPDIIQKKMYGEENYWIRVRIIGGNYGEEARYEENTVVFNTTGKISRDTSNPKKISGTDTIFLSEIIKGDILSAGGEIAKVADIVDNFNLILEIDFSVEHKNVSFKVIRTYCGYKPATFKPPSISTFTLEYNFERTEIAVEKVLTFNNFLFEDQTEICNANDGYFRPFQPVTDEDPTLYLAFKKNIATLPMTLFFPLVEQVHTISTLIFDMKGPAASEISIALQNVLGLNSGDIIEFRNPDGDTEQKKITGIDMDNNIISWEDGLDHDFSTEGSTITLPPPVLVWEYWNGNSWTLLSLEDRTQNLTKREMIEFRAPRDVAMRPCFKMMYYWIRARSIQGRYAPKVKGVHTNTVWAYNQMTVEDEILGSSNGMPDQVFHCSHSPVLSGQKVMVREVSLTEEERKTLHFEEGGGGFWVEWYGKDHFHCSRPDSRHYVIDRNNGTITFGDGEKGMIPLAEKDNIKCSYRSGGGEQGNMAGAGTITKLRTSFPYVDSVINYEAAYGGGDSVDMDKIRISGPQTLKHRDRAVTYEDFEWLVREASPKVAKVRCLPTKDPSLKFRSGWVTLMIVPESEDPKPLPTQQLISSIESYLFERTSTYLTTYPSQINLIGPGYIRVGAKARVQFITISEAKTIEGRIIDNLKQFFHPLYGGPEEEGWDFGRNVYISEVYEVIENTEGVDHVDELSLAASIQNYRLVFESIQPSASNQEYTRIETSDGRIRFHLAGRQTDKGTETLFATGFKEGDHVILSHNGNSENLVVKSVYQSDSFGDILEFEPFISSNEYLQGSTVKTYDNKVHSFIRSKIKADTEVSSLKVAKFLPEDEVVLSKEEDISKTYSGRLTDVTYHDETIFIEDNYLVYSSEHTIYTASDKVRGEQLFPYLLNTKDDSNIVHKLNNEQPNCQLDEILESHRQFISTLEGINSDNYCSYCLKN